MTQKTSMVGEPSSSSLGPWWKEPSKPQWISFGAAWLGWVLDAFDFTVFLLVMPSIAKEFHVSLTAASVSITLTLVVRLFGGLAAGAAADRWGRKLPLMISILWFAACDGAVAFAPSFLWVLVLRTIFGFGMGAEWTAGATLAMENWPERSRGIASGVLQGSWAIGYLFAATIFPWVLPHWGWRGLFLIAAAPALLVLPIRLWVPESRDFEREKKARSVGVGFFAELRAARVWPKLLWASCVMALGFAGYYGLTSQYPTLLQTQLHLGIHDVSTLVKLFNVGMMAGAITCGMLAARRGPIFAIVVPALATLLVLPFYTGLQGGHLYLGALLGGAFGAGYAGVTPLLLTSLFPSRIRARCVGFVYHAGAVLAALVPTGVAAFSGRLNNRLGLALALVVATAEIALVLALIFRPRDILEPVVLSGSSPS